ncbi:DUF541 domain-containing protein, partial [candidate division WOR-3 bacterium]|nr:DUF541 domain-containing protein [candidate division WOR-3 bacterium]MBD3364756.1 DUF541 domain-containing protein [candidate division WOR-3 bacterium]
MKTLAKILTASFCVFGILFADEEPEPRSITVTGTAEVSVAPDICYMSFIVESESRKAQEAYAENVQIMNAINQ